MEGRNWENGKIKKIKERERKTDSRKEGRKRKKKGQRKTYNPT
jgi:hypothetical protein